MKLELEWTTEKRKINDLVPYEKNPRQMTEKQNKDLTKSLEKFNLVEIPAINTDGMILAGHQRLRILQAIGRGAEEIDVRVPNRLLTPKEVQEYNIRSNKNTGEFDMDILANSFDTDDLLSWGFTEMELNYEKEVEEDDVPDVDNVNPPTAQVGDIYQLGNHRLMCGDATKIEDINKLMDGKTASMVFTDPPYNVDYQGGMHGDGTQSHRDKIKNDKMSSDDFYQFLSKVMNNLLAVTQGAFYVCMSSSELHNLWRAFTDGGGALADIHHLGQGRFHSISQ